MTPEEINRIEKDANSHDTSYFDGGYAREDLVALVAEVRRLNNRMDEMEDDPLLAEIVRLEEQGKGKGVV